MYPHTQVASHNTWCTAVWASSYGVASHWLTSMATRHHASCSKQPATSLSATTTTQRPAPPAPSSCLAVCCPTQPICATAASVSHTYSQARMPRVRVPRGWQLPHHHLVPPPQKKAARLCAFTTQPMSAAPAVKPTYTNATPQRRHHHHPAPSACPTPLAA